MAADLYPAESSGDQAALQSNLTVRMEDDGYYWHLYPYFESAKLPSDQELIDLYDGREIEGYELDRLRTQLAVARRDLDWRDESWEVVTGWSDLDLKPETEIRQTVNKAEMMNLIDRLVRLADHCAATGLKLCVCGD